jgi:nucleoside-diphosphate-sugar epimerase
MPARILITGASGFIGSALVPRLAAAGFTPRLLVRRAPAAPPPPPAEVREGDLATPATLGAAVDGADAVVHLGAATSGGRMDPAVAYRVNVGGATALIEACRAARCRRIVVMSTQHVHLPRPGLYGRTKRIADRVFEHSGLEVTILRPSLVYGPGSRGVFVKLAGLVRKLPVIPVIGPGTWHLRPLYLDDLVRIVVETLERPELAGRTYDAGGPDYVTYDEFLMAICAALGRRCRRVHLPIGVSFVLARILERVLANPPLTVENVYGSTLEAPCDLRALLRDYRPRLTPLAEGLRQTLAAAGRLS